MTFLPEEVLLLLLFGMVIGIKELFIWVNKKSKLN